jgi:hypothetical protein
MPEAEAAAICRGIGISVQPVLDACILDVSVTGDPAYAVASLGDARALSAVPREPGEGGERIDDPRSYDGVDLPGGPRSFADAVTSFDRRESPDGGASDPQDALGEPDYHGNEGFVSLGDQGVLTVEFVDNALAADGTDAIDLWVFEVGPATEAMTVAVSRDGRSYVDVGTVAGSTSGIDLDAFGIEAGELFRFVRVTNQAPGGGSTPGADVDAIAAVTAVEPG